MKIGDRYRWPDGVEIELISVMRTGQFNARYEYEHAPNDLAYVSIGPADLSVLIRHGIVELVEEEPDESS